jgi:hypothetical protein
MHLLTIVMPDSLGLAARVLHNRRTVNKIQRWALKLATYNYRIEHIAGELNVWTDLLTRC